MDERLIATLADLERFGIENDEKEAERSAKMLNITHETGEFLSMLIKIANAKKILEIGTSNGYSTIWLADAARKTGGKVTTIEADQCKLLLAEQNFAEAEVKSFIDIKRCKAEDYFQQNAKERYDFVFLDSERKTYVDIWADLQNAVVPGGVIVVDNAVSHVNELLGFMSIVKITSGFETTIVPIGNGQLLIWKEK